MRTEEGKEKQAESHAQYDKNNTKRLQCKFNLKTDADVLARLDQVQNKQGYIKRLIREDIARNQHSKK